MFYVQKTQKMLGIPKIIAQIWTENTSWILNQILSKFSSSSKNDIGRILCQLIVICLRHPYFIVVNVSLKLVLMLMILLGRLVNNCCIKMGEQRRSVLLKGAKPCSPQSAVKTPTWIKPMRKKIKILALLLSWIMEENNQKIDTKRSLWKYYQ